MMKQVLVLALLLSYTFVPAQLKLEPTDFNNLVAIGELYSKYTNGGDEKYNRSLDSLRTHRLSHMVDALIAAGKNDTSILSKRFLSRPSDDELMLWYVLREIHYNLTNDKVTPKPNTEVASQVLSKKIDPRWLLSNYYYRIHGGIAMLFNTADLSHYNFNTDELQLKNDTEKAIFFLGMMDALVGARFKVLMMMKNNDRILEFCNKLPTFNGKTYYLYKDFNYKDFDWIGYDETESYNKRHIGSFYNTLIAHFTALSHETDKSNARRLYLDSILYEPDYFKYSDMSDDLKKIYKSTK